MITNGANANGSTNMIVRWVPSARAAITALAPSWVMMNRIISTTSGPPVAFSVRSLMKKKSTGGCGEHLVLEGLAVQQLVEGEEDRQLEQQGDAGRERVDLVLLVERDQLALLALLVVLVALLERLDLRRVRLERTHRADLRDRQRQDHEPGRERQRDDREAPAEPDVVVEEGDDRIGGVDQRLEDVGDDHAGAPGSWLCPACVWPCVAEQLSVGDRVPAAVAPRVAAKQTLAREDRAAHDPELAHGLLGVGRAGRLVLAAPGQGRRDEAAVEAQRGEENGDARDFGAFHVLRPDPGLCEELAERALDAAGAVALDQPGHVGAGDEHEVIVLGEPLAEGPECLAEGALDRVSLGRAADLAAHRNAEADVLALGGRSSSSRGKA